jgi:hypothetical protein
VLADTGRDGKLGTTILGEAPDLAVVCEHTGMEQVGQRSGHENAVVAALM